MRWAATHLWCNSYIETILHHESEKLRFLSMLAPPERNAEMIGFVRWGNHRWVICKNHMRLFYGVPQTWALVLKIVVPPSYKNWDISSYWSSSTTTAHIRIHPSQEILSRFLQYMKGCMSLDWICSSAGMEEFQYELLWWRNFNKSWYQCAGKLEEPRYELMCWRN